MVSTEERNNIMDYQSIMGYANGSPYRNNPYLDINTPEGIIDMANTDMDLLGIDNTGHTQKMKAGRKKPYKFRGSQVREYPMQAGGRTPIYTSNPNDPRLQAYNDSLILHNMSYSKIPDNIPLFYQAYDRLHSPKPIPIGEEGDRYKKPVQPVIYQKPQQQNKPTYADSLRAYKEANWNYNKDDKDIPITDEQKKFWATKEGIEPIAWRTTGNWPNGNSTQRNEAGHPIFKKPLVPPTPQRPHSNISNPVLPTYNMSSSVPTVPNRPAAVSPYMYNADTPTKYSFTYPTGGDNKQKSVYFPNKSMLDDYIFQQAARGVSSQEGQDYKTASGYLQRGGYNLRKIYDFLYEDEEDDNTDNKGKEFIPTAPSEDEVEQTGQQEQQPDENDQLAMMIAFEDFSHRNPYIESNPTAKREMGVNPYLKQNEDEILGEGATNLGIWGDTAHQQRKSEHNTGDAQDFGVSDPSMGKKIVDKLQNEASQRHVKYIIYNGRIWNPSKSNEWRKYNGPDPHTTHIHVSYNR